jgi:hypothetical protein
MLSGGLLGCGRDSARVPVGGWFTGWFLFAVDARSPSDEVCAGVGIALPADLPVWPVRQTIVRSLPVGRVTGPPPPRVWILRHAIDRGDRVFVARVQCSSRCNVSITVENRTYEQTRRVALIGNKPVSVPRARLRPGSLLVSVNVDSGPTVSRRSELS